MNARALVTQAREHSVYLSECTGSLANVMRNFEGQLINDRIVAQITSLLLGSEEETRNSGSIST